MGRRTRLVIAMLGTLALAACAPGTGGVSGDGGGDGEVTLSVWSWRTEDRQGYEKIFDVYEKKHPGVTIKFRAIKNDTYETVLRNALAKSAVPDVAQLKPYGGLQPLVAGNYLVPLKGKVDFSGWSQDVLEGARGKKDGKIYGVPFGIQTTQVFYNKKIFASHGISPPKTWQQMVNAAKKLESAGVTPFAVGGKDTWMLPMIHEIFGATTYGGNQFVQGLLSGEKKFTDPDYVASLEKINELAPYFPENVTGVPYTDAQVLFTSGQAAMFPGGAFELGFFADKAPDMKLGVFEVPPPKNAVVQHPLTAGWVDGSYGVNAKSKHKKEALKLVTWMSTKEFGQLFTDTLRQISPVPGVRASNPLLARMQRNYERHGTPYHTFVYFGYGEPAGKELLGKRMQSMLAGDMSAKKVAQELQRGVSQWYEPGK